MLSSSERVALFRGYNQCVYKCEPGSCKSCGYFVMGEKVYFIDPDKITEGIGFVSGESEYDAGRIDSGIYLRLRKENGGRTFKPPYRIRKCSGQNDISWWLTNCIKSEI